MTNTLVIKERLPHSTFKTRVMDKSSNNGANYVWKDVTTKELFGDIRAILFSLPGAFTPTCTTFQLPGFDRLYRKFQEHGIAKVYCLSVNDAFVMNAWAKSLNISNVEMLPDGSGEFTRKMGMLVKKDNLGFVMRSWRYAAIANDGIIEALFVECGFSDNCRIDPYTETTPENLLAYLNGKI